MAGLIAALFGGKARPPDPDPLPGLGGYRQPYGKTGEGFPGSTHQNRTLRGKTPREAKVNADTDSGANNALGSSQIVRQQSYRGDIPPQGGIEKRITSPRATLRVSQTRTHIQEQMQDIPATNYGGPLLKTGPGNDTAGGELSRAAAVRNNTPENDPRQTTTLWKDAHIVIGQNIPGGTNVRNSFALRYKNAPGQGHTYRPAPRADQAGVVPGGQASDGNVSNTRAAQGNVTVVNRFTMNPGNGNRSWAVDRQMPYNGRGNGARGADLNGTRYYATGQADQFWNAGQGDYGIARQRGADHKRPVSFTEPAPWTTNFYDTTDSVGTPTSPNGSPEQAPAMVYISPSTGRASNSTGRTG